MKNKRSTCASGDAYYAILQNWLFPTLQENLKENPLTYSEGTSGLKSKTNYGKSTYGRQAIVRYLVEKLHWKL